MSKLANLDGVAPRLRHFVFLLVDAAWPRLGRALGLVRRCRAKQKATAFGTHRAATRALPSSIGLRSIPFTIFALFCPAAAQVKNKTSRKRQMGKKQ